MMDFKFSLAQLTVLNTSPVEIATIAAKCGYDYVSFRQIYMNLPGEPNYDLQKNKELMKETKAIFQETGLQLLDVELARIYDGVDILQYENAMVTARELGGQHILCSIWTDDKAYYTEEFAKLCDLAKQYHLTVELEYVPIAGVKNLAGAVDVLNSVQRSNAGLMVDMHHFQRAGDHIDALKKIPKDWFHFAHLCDAVAETPASEEELVRIMREERDYVGEGGIDIQGILNAMPSVPYSIELPNTKQVSRFGYGIHAKRCLETAKAYCEAHVVGRSAHDEYR
ncbi:TIM barrel protein [Peptoniphilus equinus]|uniref:TIM barrel protein n=1 Tax=Peptoniphilus equinus TaxID=3016343 RepID=A0ABY7QTC4_9FIRM|nr:TIM barrel protein [Peptoniphilus equinus]WBW50045.1 TIM barrel protein [Peptoniphilus equinus]